MKDRFNEGYAKAIRAVIPQATLNEAASIVAAHRPIEPALKNFNPLNCEITPVEVKPDGKIIWQKIKDCGDPHCRNSINYGNVPKLPTQKPDNPQEKDEE